MKSKKIILLMLPSFLFLTKSIIVAKPSNPKLLSNQKPQANDQEEFNKLVKKKNTQELERLFKSHTDQDSEGELSFNINAQDREGNTPLHYAAEGGDLGIVRMLLKNGAKTNIKNKKKLTALDIAIRKLNPACAALIAVKNAESFVKDKMSKKTKK